MKTFSLLLATLLLMACALIAPLTQGAETPTATPVSATESAAASPTEVASTVSLPPVQPPAGQAPFGKPCGDGVCQGPENAQNCPADCALTPNPSPKGVKYGQSVLAANRRRFLFLSPLTLARKFTSFLHSRHTPLTSQLYTDGINNGG